MNEAQQTALLNLQKFLRLADECLDGAHIALKNAQIWSEKLQELQVQLHRGGRWRR